MYDAVKVSIMMIKACKESMLEIRERRRKVCVEVFDGKKGVQEILVIMIKAGKFRQVSKGEPRKGSEVTQG